MKKFEILQLKKGLHLMATTSEKNRPAGYIPEECLLEYFQRPNITTPFIELVIYRRQAGRFEYLYQNRNDKWWKGFCAYGSMVRKSHPASPVEIAQKAMDREFKGLGLVVKSLQIVSSLHWRKHPWCNPFATVYLVRVLGDVPETSDRKWISADNMPKNMVMNHGLYILQCEYFLSSGPLIFTPEEPDGLPKNFRKQFKEKL
ncbi:MAG: hypothetical protein KGJ89_00575 [Patescibacteria group bacterium]|nr:hypothetical protein [Patescibacteria group bacterium]MDE2015009.1 hypothetical protein [Patescibacteria group bacterium]MDE2226437.1 hypothetical protein [Patescibacteria group bacterium]